MTTSTSISRITIQTTVGSSGANRDADADLARAADDAVRHDAVETDAGEDQREAAKNVARIESSRSRTREASTRCSIVADPGHEPARNQRLGGLPDRWRQAE